MPFQLPLAAPGRMSDSGVSCESRYGKSETTVLRLNTRDRSSSAATPPCGSTSRSVRSAGEAPVRGGMASSTATTSAAVTGVPSWVVIPS